MVDGGAGAGPRRMTKHVFYSWQSDLDPGVTRNLILRTLERAAGALKTDLEIDEADRDLAVDRDTKDVAGTPAVAETILGKIDAAAVFVADLSYVARRENGHGVPNPNVLFEYGWAAKSLGRPCVIAVMNTAFGDPKTAPLPFDLQHLRWPIAFHCPADADLATRTQAKADLTKALTAALKAVLTAEAGAGKAAALSEPHPHDVELLARVRGVLDQPLRTFLHEHNFGAPFRFDHLERLQEMNATWLGAGFEFDDEALQAEFAKVRALIADLCALVVERIYAMDRNPEVGSPKTRMDEGHGYQPETLKAIKAMNDAATNLSAGIDQFDRLSRKRIRIAVKEQAGDAAAAERAGLAEEALQRLAFDHVRGAFPSLVSRPRATLRLVPFAALDGVPPPARDVVQVLRRHAPAKVGDGQLDSDEHQWWLSAPTRRIDALPNPEGPWRLRISGGGLLEFQWCLAASDDGEQEVSLPGRRLEASVAENLRRLLDCAQDLGLDGEGLASLGFEGVANLRLLGPEREGRQLGRPDLALPVVRLPLLSKGRDDDLQAGLGVVWRLAGWPEGSPFASEVVELG
jgi:hypothetical protein